MKRMVALLMMLTTAVFCCRADLRYWTGAAGDSYWNNAANWNGGALPSYGDTVIFTNDTPISVNINAYGGVNTWPNHRVYQFDGKDVTIFSTETRYVKLHGGSGTDPRIYVTAGTTVTISNSVNSYNENGQIAKWGAGTLRQISVNANSCYAGDYSAKLRIAEGRWEMRIGTSHSYGCYCNVADVVIDGGAAFLITGYNALKASSKWTVDGTLELDTRSESSFDTISTLVGTGRVVRAESATWNPNFRISNGASGPSEFSGVFGPGVKLTLSNLVPVPDQDYAFVVGAANVFSALDVLQGDLSALRFASGIGSFDVRKLDASSLSEIVLQDAVGFPVDLHVTSLANTENLSLSGSGTFRYDNAAKLTFSGGKLDDFTGTISGPGKYVFSGAETVSRLETGGRTSTDVSVSVKGDLKILDGGESLAENAFSFDAANAAVEISGGFFHSGVSADARESLPYAKPSGFVFAGDAAGSGTFRVSGDADVTLNGAENSGVGLLSLEGGYTRIVTALWPASGATAGNPSVVKLDGGTVAIRHSDANRYKVGLMVADKPFRLGIGERGGTLAQECAYTDYMYTLVAVPYGFESMSGGADDGALTVRGIGTWRFSKAWTMDGRVSFMGTPVTIGSLAELKATPDYFGTGDVHLDNSVISYNYQEFSGADATATLRLATGLGRKLFVDGSSALLLRGRSSSEGSFAAAVAQNVEIGELAFGKGGALVLSDYSATLGSDGGSSVKVLNEAVAIHPSNGRVLAPVFGVRLNDKCATFLSYDPARGFVGLSNAVSSFEDASGKVVVLGDRMLVELRGNVDYAADAVELGNWSSVELGSGATLTIGDGENPAQLILCGNDHISCSGTVGEKTGLYFCGNEAYVVGGASGDADYSASLAVPIRSGGDVTFMSWPDHNSSYRCMSLQAENAYVGRTYVNSIRLNAKNVRCFSTGCVHVGGGQFSGGSVRFAVSGTWANDFVISGWGMMLSSWGTTRDRGALEFTGPSVRLTGGIELSGETRFYVAENSEAVLEGVISGDHLDVFKSPGRIKFANSNTYTNGTHVIESTLALVKGDSAGTGPIVLDGGVLSLENTAEVIVSNRMEGVGTVALRGAAPVCFRGDLSQLDAPLDLMGTLQTFVEPPPFAVIANSAAKKATIRIGDGLGRVFWGDHALDGKISLDIGEGSELDLGGRTLTVYRLEAGAIGKVVNGTVIEQRPLAGMAIILR